jgi:3',5'-nucleoside bisphosphate phosphatase
VQVVQEYKNRVRFLSGGSDYHAGHKKGEKKPRYLGERGLSTSEFQPLFEQLS